ncbi:unnamed protein product [Trichobilharzia szidati]|nr:unnamed protein product [Trichobilharzia szidati]
MFIFIPVPFWKYLFGKGDSQIIENRRAAGDYVQKSVSCWSAVNMLYNIFFLFQCLRKIDLQRCWNPLILIDNILSESKEQHWIMTEKNEAGEIYIVERRRLRGVFLETLELNDFPLDVQDLTITLTSERPESEVQLIPDKNEPCRINLQTLVDQQEWKLHEHIEITRRSATQEYTHSSQSHPCISVTCRAARRPGYFYWNVFLIMVRT